MLGDEDLSATIRYTKPEKGLEMPVEKLLWGRRVLIESFRVIHV